MARAKVTLTLTANELQVVKAALEMFAHVSRQWSEAKLKGYAYPADIVDGNPMKGARVASGILRDIGMK